MCICHFLRTKTLPIYTYEKFFQHTLQMISDSLTTCQ